MKLLTQSLQALVGLQMLREEFLSIENMLMADLAIDIKENDILAISPELLNALLRDNTLSTDERQVNIFWATDNYAERGVGYQYNDEIKIENITGENGMVIVPRSVKSREQQLKRVRDKAEVFTPSWVCNLQNNLVDEAWFDRKGVFNTGNTDKTWTVNPDPIEFPEGKTWRDYVRDTRLEITCGEAPYIASRYDTVSGERIPIDRRVGMLDRKLRVISENVDKSSDWLKWAKIAYQCVFGYEWQGDNLLLARENLLFTFIDYYSAKFNRKPRLKSLLEIARIIAWNFWQMDGLKGVVPNSCEKAGPSKNPTTIQLSCFEPIEQYETKKPAKVVECPGCKKRSFYSHRGKYCYMMDWDEGKPVKFISLLNGWDFSK